MGYVVSISLLSVLSLASLDLPQWKELGQLKPLTETQISVNFTMPSMLWLVSLSPFFFFFVLLIMFDFLTKVLTKLNLNHSFNNYVLGTYSVPTLECLLCYYTVMETEAQRVKKPITSSLPSWNL